MGERARKAAPGLVKEHLVALCQLPFGSEYYDRTARIDVRLLEIGEADLANELAVLEERLAEVAEAVGEPATRKNGVGRLFRHDEELLAHFVDLLGRALPLLGEPAPGDLAGKVAVGIDLQVPGESGKATEKGKRGRLDAEIN